MARGLVRAALAHVEADGFVAPIFTSTFWGLLSSACAPAYRPHTERTVRTSSGVAGSFVLSGTRNSWGPPIPSCIVNPIDSVVDSRGLKVV